MLKALAVTLSALRLGRELCFCGRCKVDELDDAAVASLVRVFWEGDSISAAYTTYGKMRGIAIITMIKKEKVQLYSLLMRKEGKLKKKVGDRAFA